MELTEADIKFNKDDPMSPDRFLLGIRNLFHKAMPRATLDDHYHIQKLINSTNLAYTWEMKESLKELETACRNEQSEWRNKNDRALEHLLEMDAAAFPLTSEMSDASWPIMLNDFLKTMVEAEKKVTELEKKIAELKETKKNIEIENNKKIADFQMRIAKKRFEKLVFS